MIRIFVQISLKRGGAYDIAVFGNYQFFGRYFGNLNKSGRYSVFQSPSGDGKIQSLIKNTTVTVLYKNLNTVLWYFSKKSTIIR